MPKPNDNFDDSTAPYFLGGVLALLATIFTILRLRSASRARSEAASAFRCSCGPCQRKSTTLSLSQGSAAWRLLKNVAVVALWVAALYVLYRGGIFEARPSAAEDESAGFNPYDILGVPEGATVDEIKQAYRRLSLKAHPDKNRDDPRATDKFIRITKAYESLTDELVRRNWEMYGNPDGPVPVKVGIALPTWLLDAKNSKVVLLMYFLGFIVLVPGSLLFVLFRWGKKTQFNVKRRTMQIYVQGMPPKVTSQLFIDLLCMSDECHDIVKVRPGDDKDIPRLLSKLPAPSRILRKGIPPYGIKAITLMRAHMAGLHDDMSPEHRRTLNAFLAASPELVGAMASAAQIRGMYVSAVQILKYGQLLIQGAREDRPLLQVPHFDVLRSNICKNHNIDTPHELALAFKDEARRGALLAELGLAGQQAEDVTSFVRHVFGWKLKIEAEAHVGDDERGPKNVLPINSLATLRVRVTLVPAVQARRGPSGRRGRPKATNTPLEGGVVRSQPGQEEDNAAAAEHSEELPRAVTTRTVHAPFYPYIRHEGWWFILGQPNKGILWGVTRGSVPVAPDMPAQGAQIRFPTPKATGRYQLRLNVMSDSYYGRDAAVSVNIHVVKPEDIPEEPEPQEELSEEDEDILDDLSDEEEDEDEEEDTRMVDDEEPVPRRRKNTKHAKKVEKEPEEQEELLSSDSD
eukprot:m51a1_g3278 putative secretory complex protein (688) ;mRNA; r:249736-252080